MMRSAVFFVLPLASLMIGCPPPTEPVTPTPATPSPAVAACKRKSDRDLAQQARFVSLGDGAWAIQTGTRNILALRAVRGCLSIADLLRGAFAQTDDLFAAKKPPPASLVEEVRLAFELKDNKVFPVAFGDSRVAWVSLGGNLSVGHWDRDFTFKDMLERIEKLAGQQTTPNPNATAQPTAGAADRPVANLQVGTVCVPCLPNDCVVFPESPELQTPIRPIPACDCGAVREHWCSVPPPDRQPQVCECIECCS